MFTWQRIKRETGEYKKKPYNKYRHGTLARLRWRTLVRDNFTCQYCGRNPQNHGVALHVDHVDPKHNGGEDDILNMITSCEDCNKGKGKYYYGEAFTNKFQDHIKKKDVPAEDNSSTSEN